MIKFQKHYVQNTENGAKARVRYSATDHYGNPGFVRPAVVLYCEDHDLSLERVFGDEARNDSEPMTDYFQTSRVVLRPEHPLYVAAKARACA